MNVSESNFGRPCCGALCAKLPIAPWGWREIHLFGWPLVGVAIALLLLGKPWCWVSLIPLILLVWLVSFFRDPWRRIPEDSRAIVAPADGLVVEVSPLDQYDFIGGPAVRVGIFLSIFNVHINRAPTGGRVVEMNYHPGEFLNAMHPESAERNEFMWIGFEELEPPARRFAVRQISGMLARRIVCTLQPGQTVTRGEKFGMIKLGSRTELIMPADAVEIITRIGDKVHAGSDIIARWK